jgi:hypothetical protein
MELKTATNPTNAPKMPSDFRKPRRLYSSSLPFLDLL